MLAVVVDLPPVIRFVLARDGIVLPGRYLSHYAIGSTGTAAYIDNLATTQVRAVRSTGRSAGRGGYGLRLSGRRVAFFRSGGLVSICRLRRRSGAEGERCRLRSGQGHSIAIQNLRFDANVLGGRRLHGDTRIIYGAHFLSDDVAVFVVQRIGYRKLAQHAAQVTTLLKLKQNVPDIRVYVVHVRRGQRHLADVICRQVLQLLADAAGRLQIDGSFEALVVLVGVVVHTDLVIPDDGTAQARIVER